MSFKLPTMAPIQSKDNRCTDSYRCMLARDLVFLLLTLATAVAAGYVCLHFDKAVIHLWMNSVHTAALDSFFRYYTVVGEWIPYVVVFLLLFYKAGWSVYMLASLVVSGLLSQRLKYVFDTDRPYRFFAEHYPDVQLPFVDGVTLSKYYSFPSGHTTTFFVLFFVLSVVLTAWLSKRMPTARYNRSGQRVRACLIYGIVPMLCWLAAVTGAYSRIYLSQHFLEDICGGLVLGMVTALLLYIPVPRLTKTRFWNWHVPRFWRG